MFLKNLKKLNANNMIKASAILALMLENINIASAAYNFNTFNNTGGLNSNQPLKQDDLNHYLNEKMPLLPPADHKALPEKTTPTMRFEKYYQQSNNQSTLTPTGMVVNNLSKHLWTLSGIPECNQIYYALSQINQDAMSGNQQNILTFINSSADKLQSVSCKYKQNNEVLSLLNKIANSLTELKELHNPKTKNNKLLKDNLLKNKEEKNAALNNKINNEVKKIKSEISECRDLCNVLLGRKTIDKKLFDEVQKLISDFENTVTFSPNMKFNEEEVNKRYLANHSLTQIFNTLLQEPKMLESDKKIIQAKYQTLKKLHENFFINTYREARLEQIYNDLDNYHKEINLYDYDFYKINEHHFKLIFWAIDNYQQSFFYKNLRSNEEMHKMFANLVQKSVDDLFRSVSMSDPNSPRYKTVCNLILLLHEITEKVTLPSGFPSNYERE